MPTVTTTTAGSGSAFGFPNQVVMQRAPDTGHLWLAFRTTDTQISLYRSIDAGGSWQSQGSFTRSGLFELADMRVDQAGDHLHLVFLVNESSLDKVMYRRIDIRTGTASLTPGEMTIATGGNGGTGRDYFYSASIYPYKNPDGTFAILIFTMFHQTAYSGLTIFGVSIKNDTALTTYGNNGIIKTTRTYRIGGDDSGGLTCSVDVEHNGDGYTTTKPNVWAAFQIFDKAYALKLTWQGYKSGWSSPTSAPLVGSSRSGVRDLPARWDGKRFVVTSLNPGDNTKVDVFERDAGNTKNVVKRTSPTHPNPSPGINANAVNYNHVTQDVRLFAAGTSPGPVYYVDFIRQTGVWGAWTQVDASSVVAAEWGVRNSTYGTSQYDMYRVTGASSPWTVSTISVGVNFAPTAPTWVVGAAGTVITNGAAADVSQSLTFDWNHNDPNTADTQSQYALKRTIGGGSPQWWRTSDSTWQAVETFNTSATTAVTLTSGQWVGGGGAADPAHVYQVATKDSGGLTSPYSSNLGVVPSTRVDPTLTAPVGGSTLNTGLVAATWTITEQSAYRVTVTNTATGVVAHDSGWQTDPGASPTVLSCTVPTLLPDGFAGQLTLQSRNAEGLASLVRTASFTVDFVEPVAPLITGLTAAPSSGGNLVTVTQSAPTGTQPVTQQVDLWRRKYNGAVASNLNPYFESNANDWNQSGYTSAVRSTAQAHQGVASLLCTPNGSTAAPYAQTLAIVPTVGGEIWEGRAWVRSTTANKTIRVKLQWYNSVPSVMGESVRDFTPVAGVWIWCTWQAVVPDGLVGVRWAIGQTGTPAVGDTLFIDEAVLIKANPDEGIRIGFDVDVGVPVLDWRAVGGTDYEYRAYAEAANGTDVWGPWQA